MTAYDDLSPRARWFLENYSDLDLAEMCADRERADMVAMPREAFDQLVKVATHVSLGRSAALTQGVYPDASARRALGALDDAGLLRAGQQEEQEEQAREVASGSCPFCEIVAGRAPAKFVYTWPDAVAFTPLNPVTDGHTLVVPRRHVTDFAADPEVSAATMRRAAEAAAGLRPGGPMNLITSWGAAATQSVFHLHLHLVPRAENDGLALPWYSGRTNKPKAAH